MPSIYKGVGANLCDWDHVICGQAVELFPYLLIMVVRIFIYNYDD